MKKLILSLLILGFLTVGISSAEASVLGDLINQINALRSKMTASVIDSVTGVSIPGTSITDLTPRIMYWSGKIDQHVDLKTGQWETDPDGVSGAGEDILSYCKKWYPNTTSYKEYKLETISTWRAWNNTGEYSSTKMSYECIQGGTSVSCKDSDGGKNYYIKGNTSGLPNSSLGTRTYGIDTCYTPSSSGTGGITGMTGTYLLETYCLSTSQMAEEEYKCLNGCSNGACVGDSKSIIVTWPSSGTPFVVDQEIVVQWNASGFPADTMMDIKVTDGIYTGPTVSSINDGYQSYKLAKEYLKPGNQYKAIISLKSDSSIKGESGTFNINSSMPSVKVTFPNGGNTFTGGQKITVTWESLNMSQNELVNIYLNVPSKVWSLVLATRTVNDGEETITLSNSLSEYGNIFKIIVSPATVNVVQDSSDNFFTINAPSSLTPSIPQVSSPVASNVTSTSVILSAVISNLGYPSTVLEKGFCYGEGTNPRFGGAVSTCVSTTGTQLSKSIYLLKPSTKYYFKGYAKNSTGIGYSDDGTFTTLSDIITPSIVVTYPTGGETFTAGQQITVKWESVNVVADVVGIILYDVNNQIKSNIYPTTNDGTETITLPNITGSNFKIFITNDQTNGAYSKAFNISPATTPSITVLSPNGGETYKLGDKITVKWRTENSENRVIGFDLCRVDSEGDCMNTFLITRSQLVNDGSEDVTIPTNATNGSNYKFRVASYDMSAPSSTLYNNKVDWSDNSFTITNSVITPSITVVSPNGGETYKPGDKITVKWTSNIPTSESMLIEMLQVNNINDPVPLARWIILSYSTPNDGIQTFTLDSNITPGKYELAVKRNSLLAGDDISDNTFTITSSTTDFSAATVSQCLKDKGAILYGTSWCPHCQAQKEIFGNYISNITYVECSTPDGTGQTDICKQANITGYPTWRFKDGTELIGEQSLQALANKAGCGVTTPTSSNPQCSDGLDNDSDGTLDQGDTSCHFGLSLYRGYIYSFNSENSSDLLTARTLRLTYPRMRGNDVMALQKYLGLTADGVFGYQTMTAVKAWQTRNGLVADGVFGPAGYAKMYMELFNLSHV